MGIEGIPWAFNPNERPPAPNPRQQQLQAQQQLRRYLSTLSPAERQRYLQNQQQVVAGPPAPQNAPQAPAGQQAQQPPPEVHFHVPRPSQDARSPLERMGDNVEEAMRDENDSRVSQMREAKRMQHAKELESMRQEGLLKRLQAMNDSSYEQPASAPSGPVGVFDPEAGQFRYYNGVRFG